jgi:hypothetical protein
MLDPFKSFVVSCVKLPPFYIPFFAPPLVVGAAFFKGHKPRCSSSRHCA